MTVIKMRDILADKPQTSLPEFADAQLALSDWHRHYAQALQVYPPRQGQ
jgi:hypothetical protein